MKKYLMMAAVASMALVGCVSEESENLTQQQARKISFDIPVMGTQSRAGYDNTWMGFGEITGTEFPKSDSFDFAVFANMHDDNYTKWSDGKNFWNWTMSTDWNDIASGFDVRQFRYDETKKAFVCTSTEEYYYPNDYQLRFDAYAPHVALSSLEVQCDDDGLTITNYPSFSGPSWSAELSSCYDLMYTGITESYTAETQPTNGVPLEFKHTLSSIAVVLNIPSEGEFTYLINGVSINGTFVTTATFKENYNVQGKNAGWLTDTENSTRTEMTFSFPLPGEDPDEEGKTSYTLNGGKTALLVIPQSVPESASMTIEYTMYNNSEHHQFSKNIPLLDFKKQNNESITTWEMANRYIYIVNFVQSVRVPLKFNPTVVDWADGGSAEYTITN